MAHQNLHCMVFSWSLAKEYARFGITSNVLSLGYFGFRSLQKTRQVNAGKFLESVPTKKLGTAEDIHHA